MVYDVLYMCILCVWHIVYWVIASKTNQLRERFAKVAFIQAKTFEF